MVKAAFSSNVTDPVADLLTRIRNANTAYKDDLLAPASKLSVAILDILAGEGFIEGYEREGEGVHQRLRIRLKYGPRKQRTISGLRRISRPGRRFYRGRSELPGRRSPGARCVTGQTIGLSMEPLSMEPRASGATRR